VIISDYQKIPFYGNTEDNTHCNQAGMKMVLGYYFPEEEYSWDNLEIITGKREGKWTWPMKGWLYLAKKGLTVTYYGTFDYERFVKEGAEYLIDRYGEEVGSAQIENSEIEYEINTTKEMLPLIQQVKVIPKIENLERFISEDKLLLINVNYYPLYGKKGYAGHFVLVYGIDDEYVYLQDPGLPPNPNAKISKNNFEKAWAYSGEENKGVATISRSK